jgi:capsule polysaccharide modification protein KpsS
MLAHRWLVCFSEPYEIGYWRTEEIYGEILPSLCQVARSRQKRVVLKLHPFENAKHRWRMLRNLLAPDDLRLVSVAATPMSPELLRSTWCAVVGVSTAALDCVLAGIPTFLCGWLPGLRRIQGERRLPWRVQFNFPRARQQLPYVT